MSETSFQLDRAVTLLTLDRQSLRVHAQHLRVGSNEVRLRLRLSHAQWLIVLRDELFNTDVRLGAAHGMQTGFVASRPVHVDLALRPSLATALFGDIDVVTAFFESPEESGLDQTEAWRLLYAVQNVDMPAELESATASVGFQTAWNHAPEGEPADLTQVVADFFASRDVPAERLYDDMFVVRLEHERHSWRVIVRADKAQGVCTVYSVFEAPVPPSRRNEAARAFCSLTQEFELSTIELDVDDGEIRLRTGIDVRGAQLDPVVFGRLFDVNVRDFVLLAPTFVELTTRG